MSLEEEGTSEEHSARSLIFRLQQDPTGQIRLLRQEKRLAFLFGLALGASVVLAVVAAVVMF